MEPLRFSWYDYIIFLMMVGFSITIGIYYGFFDKNNAGTSNYFYGGKKLQVIPTSVSLIASFISVTDLLGIPAEVYMHGTQYWATIFAVPIMGLIMNYLYLPVIYKLKLNSMYEYLEIRFNKKISRFMTICFIIFCGMFVPLMIFTPALALSQVTGFNKHYIMWVVTAICLFYTAVGGLKAIIWSDTLQFGITMGTLLISLIMGVTTAGGLNNVWNISKDGKRIEFFRMDPDPTIRTTFWNVFIGHTFHWSTIAGTHHAATQRLFSLKTFNDAQRVLLIFCAGMIITKCIVCFLGLVIYARYSKCDPVSIGLIQRADQILPYYVLDIVKEIPGISVLFISGLFSMCFSVLSTLLNVIAYLTYSDVVLPIFPKLSEKGGNYVTKVLTILIGLISLLLVLVIERLGSIFEMTYAPTGAVAGASFGLLMLGLVVPSANTKGAFCGMIVSIAVMTFIVFKKNSYVWKGDIQYLPKPLRIDGCNNTFALLNTTLLNSTLPSGTGNNQPHWLFRISFHYHIMMGSLIVIVIGSIISVITRKIDDPPVNQELLSPIIRKLCSKPKRYTYHHPISSSSKPEESNT